VEVEQSSDAARGAPDPGRQLTLVAHDVAPIGGMERAVHQVTLGLLDRGWKVRVVARSCELPAHPNLTVTRVRTPARPFLLAYPLFAIVASLHLLRTRRPLMSLGAVTFNRSDAVIVQFCHAGFAAAGPFRRRSRDTLPYRLNESVGRWMASTLERVSYRRGRVRVFLPVSERLADEIRTHFDPTAEIVTVPNGVEPDRFRPDPESRSAVRAELRYEQDDPVVLFVGGDWERKGLRTLIDAVARVPEWRILVVGRGDEAAYGDYAADRSVRVTFAGVRSDVQRYFAAADALALPSRYEGFALVALEAAAAGLPLLVTPSSGAEHLVEPGREGWVLEPDVSEFVQPLRELLDVERRQLMGANARESALRFGWERISDEYSGALQRLLR
jgi:UDP-glucose:(heptosyl)LPS alpha-1,3-glucosyltransferase